MNTTLKPLAAGFYIHGFEINGEPILRSIPPTVLRTVVEKALPEKFHVEAIDEPAVFAELQAVLKKTGAALLKINRLDEGQLGLWVCAENQHLLCYRVPNATWEEMKLSVADGPKK